MIRITGFFVIMILTAGTGWAQKITGYSTLYDDRFDKWILVTDDPNVEGGLEATWAVMQDWSEWQYTLGHRSGWIRLRNKNNLNIWEVVGDGQILEVRTISPMNLITGRCGTEIRRMMSGCLTAVIPNSGPSNRRKITFIFIPTTRAISGTGWWKMRPIFHSRFRSVSHLFLFCRC